MKLAAIAKLIKADGYCKLYKVFYDDCRTYDLYIGTKTAIFPLTGFPKAQNESELATLLGISKKEWADIEFDNDCPDDLHHIEGMDLDDTADGEMDCVTGRIGIRYCGCELVPMIEPVSGTVGFVDAKQIMPVADEIRKSGYFKYCARKMASGGRYYVIKDGMVKLRRDSSKRMKNKIKYWETAYPAGEATKQEILLSFDAWDAHAAHGDTYAKDGNRKLSANFAVKEFRCKDGSDPIFIDDELVTLLQKIRDHFGKSVTITSAYRTAAHNKAVKGATYSQHCYGKAADIRVQGVGVEAVAAYAETLLPNRGGIGRYPVKAGRPAGWVHIDTRTAKSRWVS